MACLEIEKKDKLYFAFSSPQISILIFLKVVVKHT